MLLDLKSRYEKHRKLRIAGKMYGSVLRNINQDTKAIQETTYHFVHLHLRKLCYNT